MDQVFGVMQVCEKYRIVRRVLMAEVRGGRVWGRPRLGWVNSVKVSLGNRGMTVEAERQCVKDAYVEKEWRKVTHVWRRSGER